MITTDSMTGGVLDLVLSAGPLAKIVLGVLLVFSVVSWALIVEKWWQFRRVRRQTLAFTKVYRPDRRPSLVYAEARKYSDSPLAQLYASAYQELWGIGDVTDALLEEGDDSTARERLEPVERALRRAAGMQIAHLERYLPFLATTASATPFIGLFGTVWGVMSAFHGIGTQGSASLAVVAPGISEALIATAAGLGAAIPAVIGYNYFVNRVKHWATEMDGFTLELLNHLGRTLPKLSRRTKDGV
ncbi:MAG TPA: MotA/TolQ/ExbB proton channel family protein [Vicinamibacteria bacterium]|nr:MotA/TolQ/ExbB proton channel family protein [Vicinamibacteria bacterium]